MSQRLAQVANELTGAESMCVRAYSDALEVIPYTLAENAGTDGLRARTEPNRGSDGAEE